MAEKNNNKHQPLLRAFEARVSEDELRQFRDRDLELTDVYKKVINDLEQDLGDQLPKAIADYLVDPPGYFDESVVMQPFSGEPSGTSPYHFRLACVAAVYIKHNPSEYASQKLIERLTHMVENGFEQAEIPPSNYSPFTEYDFAGTYFFPRANTCFQLLAAQLPVPAALTLLQGIVTGKFFKTHFDEDDDHRFSNYERLFDYDLGEALLMLFKQIHKTDALSADFFNLALKYFPAAAELDMTGQPADFVNAYRSCVNHLQQDILADLPNRAEQFQELYSYEDFEGLKWVLLGLQEISRQKLNAAKLRGRNDYAISVRQLLGVEELGKDSGSEDHQKALNQFDKAILKLALPHCVGAKDKVLDALGMSELASVDQFIRKLRDDDYVDNCEDTSNGVIELAKLLSLTDSCNNKELIGYLSEYSKVPEAPKNELMLVMAACNIDRDKIEKRMVRHGQTAIKAYGLFPIQDKADLQTRYLRFKTMHKEASQYGSERSANTRAAVAAGLSNLAQAAGFTDANRMEWALEADLAEDSIPFNEWQPTDEWEICLRLEGLSPRIAVRRGEKPLKSVPAKVRQHSAYKEMRAVQDQIKGQASRFKSTLQSMMCHGDVIEAEELSVLRRLPVVAAMLSQLIMKDDKGHLGFYDAKTDSLIDCEGSARVVGGSLVIAHALDLFKAEQLSAWQRRTVELRLVQPFKQVFRELYILTPAEIEAKNISMRFSGHKIDSAIGGRLFQTRGWSTGHQEYPYVERIEPAFGMTASISFENFGHFFAEYDEVIMGEIEFRSREGKANLADVNPLMFSEVMRDADLVASVAQLADSERWSAEAALNRRQLLTVLIDTLAMTNVVVKDNHAHVKGQLADYTVHLGSGVIHIVPGNYLCIVPAQKPDDKMYLPFADTDSKMQEIISKVLMLSNDDRITDRSILDQISPAQQRSA